MSSHPNMPDQPVQPPPPSFSHAQGNLYGPTPFDGSQIHRERSSPGLVLAAIGLGLALIGVCVKLLLPSEEAVPDTTQAAPVMAIPENARNASGDDWTMKISPKWAPIKVPKSKAEASWQTDTVGRFPGLVMVLADTEASSMGLDDYLETTMLDLQQDNPTAKMISDGIFQAPDHEYGRLEFTHKNASGRTLHSVFYIAPTEDGFAAAIYGSVAPRFADTAPKIEPFLATMQAK